MVPALRGGATFHLDARLNDFAVSTSVAGLQRQPRDMRRPELFVTMLLAFTTLGCASSLFRRVERETEPMSLNASSDDHLLTPNTRVDPTSYVRFETRHGRTDWFRAALLEVNDHGVVLRASLEGPVTEVKITGVGESRRAELLGVKAGGQLTAFDDGVWVKGDDVRDWLAAAAKTGSPDARERWRLEVSRAEEGGRLTELYLTGDFIFDHHGLPAVYQELLPWAEITAFRTNRFNTRPVAALLGLVAALGSLGITDLGFLECFVAPPGISTAVLTGSGPRRADPADYDDDWPLHFPLLGLEPTAADLETAHPIFTASARRKHVVRPELSVESGGELVADDRSFGGGVWLGVRLFDLFELAGGPEAWWPEPMRASGWVSPGPLAPSRSSSRPYWLTAGRAQVVLDLHPDRRVSMLFGAQVSGGAEGIWRLRFTWGLQFRLFAGLFLNLRPFTPTYTFGWPAAGWRFPSTLELGCTF